MITEYHNYIEKNVDDLDSNKRILFGIWCTYNNLNDKKINKFIKRESEGAIDTSIIKKFLEDLWKSIFTYNENSADLTKYGIHIKDILNNTPWVHDEIVSRNPENEHLSWVCILIIGGIENFMDYITAGNIQNLLMCAESNLNIADYRSEFGLISNKKALKDEVDTQILFINQLRVGAIDLKGINKYSERFI